ncbi:hypothetical protein SprV_0200911400 [Sparganum proliferum]
MQDAWMTLKTAEIQGYAARNESRNFFVAIKAIYGSQTKGTASQPRWINAFDGEVVDSEALGGAFQKRPQLSLQNPHASIDRLPQGEINVDLNFLPSNREIIRVVQQLSSEKVPGSDIVPPEIYKHSDHRLMDRFTMHMSEDVTLWTTSSGFRGHNHRAPLKA